MTFACATPVESEADLEALERQSFAEAAAVRSTYEILERSARAHPDGVAISFLPTGEVEAEAVRITYRQLFARGTQAANMFHALGVGPKDAVSFLLPLLPQGHFTFWGACTAGIVNPINFLLSAENVADLMNAAGAKVVVALGPHPALDIWQKIEAIRDQVPSLEAVLTVGQPVEGEGIFDFDTLLAEQPADHLVSGRDIQSEDVAAYFHTGGTTGAPKLAQHLQRNHVYTAWASPRMYGLNEETRVINGLPLFHVAGPLNFGIAVLGAGGEIILPSPAGMRNPDIVANHWKLVEKYRPNFIGGIPTSLAAILNVPVGESDISSVSCCMTGGAPLPREMARSFEERFGVPIHEVYGMTECSGVIAITPTSRPRKPGYSGLRLPHERIEVRAMNSDGSVGHALAAGESGVVVISGPHVFAGYRSTEHNAGVFTDDGWLISGDLGHLDDEGFLAITGRAKDLIIRGGHNIDPSIIEQALDGHPAVEMCAAVGMPDAYAGELPVAYVTLNPGAAATAEELDDYLAERISERPAKPKAIFIVDQLPLTAIAKIFKPELRQDAARRVFSALLQPLSGDGFEVEVEVGHEKKRGMVATIKLAGGEEAGRPAAEAQVAEVFVDFAVPHDVIWK